MKKSVRNTLIVASSIGGCSIAVESLFRHYFARNSVKGFKHSDEINQRMESDRIIHEGWFTSSKTTSLNLRSYDGLNLHGILIENNNTNNYVIFSHGHSSCISNCLDYYYHLSEMGYNILALDHRACGESEGTFSTMGKMESLDLINWISYLNEIRPNSSIILYGVSMGASSILLALGSKLPLNINAVISDCGYARFEDVVTSFIHTAGLPSYVIRKSFETLMKARLNISYKDLDCTEALKDNRIPLLLVHGKEDQLVNFKEMKILYNSSINSKRKYYPVSNAGHGECHYSENYYKNIDMFIKGCL